MSVALLPDVLTGALLEVAVAWGADLTAADTTWTWTDITADARLLPGIEPTNGRADEASTTQPASCTVTLDNTGGKYSLGPTSTNYPYVRRSTPVRVRVRPATAAAWVVVFQGGAVEWQPNWNLRGNLAEVKLVAAGTLRRLGQGSAAVLSSIRRALTNSPAIVAYWPCEDGKTAARFAPAVGGRPMSWSGTPKLAESDVFDCSNPIPDINGAIYFGDIPAYTPAANGEVTLRALIAWPATPANGSIPLRLYTSGSTITRADMVYNTGGLLSLNLYDYTNTLVATTGQIVFGVDGLTMRLGLTLRITGGFIEMGMNMLTVGDLSDSGYGLVTAVAATTTTLGVAARVQINPTRGLTGTPLGHVSLETGSSSLSLLRPQLNANIGEDPFNRVVRLCSENNIPLASASFADGSVSLLDSLGPQKVDTVLGLLRDTETAGQGVLFDGLSAGLFYRTRRARESAAAVLTLNASAGQLSSPFDVVDDDQRTRNSATVTSSGGGSASTYQDLTGPLGVQAIGLYDTTDQISVQFEAATLQFAGWLVAQGTVFGYRYPQITIDLRKNPSLVPSWLAVQPGTRIDITNLSAVLPGHPPGTVSLMVEGVTNRFDDDGWAGTAKCSPYMPWRIASYANPTTTGDDAWITRADGTGTTGAAITSASSSVAVTPTLPWITTAAFPGEFPFDVDVRGQKVTVTAITGSGLATAAVAEDFDDASLDVTLTGTWLRTNTQAYLGSWSLRSASISDGQTTDTVLSLPFGSKRVEFAYRVSSESGYDYFRVLVDGVAQLQASGTVGWTYTALDVTGASTVTFRYTKDGSGLAGEDAAYIDPIIIYTAVQTFTITAAGVVGTIPSGSSLQLWQPTTPGL